MLFRSYPTGNAVAIIEPGGRLVFEDDLATDAEYRTAGLNVWPDAEYSGAVETNLVVDVDHAETTPTASGGGTEALAKENADSGVITAVEITEEDFDS